MEKSKKSASVKCDKCGAAVRWVSERDLLLSMGYDSAYVDESVSSSDALENLVVDGVKARPWLCSECDNGGVALFVKVRD